MTHRVTTTQASCLIRCIPSLASISLYHQPTLSWFYSLHSPAALVLPWRYLRSISSSCEIGWRPTNRAPIAASAAKSKIQRLCRIVGLQIWNLYRYNLCEFGAYIWTPKFYACSQGRVLDLGTGSGVAWQREWRARWQAEHTSPSWQLIRNNHIYTHTVTGHGYTHTCIFTCTFLYIQYIWYLFVESEDVHRHASFCISHANNRWNASEYPPDVSKSPS